MPKRCKFSTAGALLTALLASGGPAAGENRTTVSEAPAHAPAEGAAPRVPVRRLLSDPGALAKWLYARNPDMGAAKARVDQAEAGLSQSRVIPNPTLFVAVSGSPNPTSVAPGGPDATFGDTVNYSIGLSETVEIGKRGPRARAAELRRNSARAATQDVLADHLADARDALARVVYLTERSRVLEERLLSARHVAELERVRLEHGDISGIDQDRLELEASAVARGYADNRVDLESAIADCAALLLGSCWPVDAEMDSVDTAVPTPETLPSLASMIRARPDIRAALLAGAAAKTDAIYFRRYAIPDPTFGVAYARDFYTLAGNQAHMLTASVALPLALFDHGQHLARSAEGQAAELGFHARSLEARAEAAARALLSQRNILRDKLEALTKLAVPRADAVLKSSDDAYHRGQLSLTDLLLVRREHASLLLDALDTRYELFSVRNTLYRTLGLGTSDANVQSTN